ncbi:MAG: hypothetical protein GY759_12970, partial [Chloroflexi bacterium]|nr:hypothetical protein [Chloroflexota bacterium]
MLVTNGLSFDPLADIRVELWASDSPDDVGRFVRTSFSVADGFFYFPPTVYFGQGYLHLLVNPTPAHIPRSAMSGSGVVVSPNHIRLVPSPGADFGDNTFVLVHNPSQPSTGNILNAYQITHSPTIDGDLSDWAEV